MYEKENKIKSKAPKSLVLFTTKQKPVQDDSVCTPHKSVNKTIHAI